jgi:hypothetical protein
VTPLSQIDRILRYHSCPVPVAETALASLSAAVFCLAQNYVRANHCGQYCQLERVAHPEERKPGLSDCIHIRSPPQQKV